MRPSGRLPLPPNPSLPTSLPPPEMRRAIRPPPPPPAAPKQRHGPTASAPTVQPVHDWCGDARRAACSTATRPFRRSHVRPDAASRARQHPPGRGRAAARAASGWPTARAQRNVPPTAPRTQHASRRYAAAAPRRAATAVSMGAADVLAATRRPSCSRRAHTGGRKDSRLTRSAKLSGARQGHTDHRAGHLQLGATAPTVGETVVVTRNAHVRQQCIGQRRNLPGVGTERGRRRADGSNRCSRHCRLPVPGPLIAADAPRTVTAAPEQRREGPQQSRTTGDAAHAPEPPAPRFPAAPPQSRQRRLT